MSAQQPEDERDEFVDNLRKAWKQIKSRVPSADDEGVAGLGSKIFRVWQAALRHDCTGKHKEKLEKVKR